MYASVQDLLTYLRLRKSGSLMSAKSHCRVLATFSRSCGIDPDRLLKLPRDRIETLVQEHCDRLMEISRLRGPSARYANGALTCLKTFFACNDFNRENGLELRVKRYHQPPRITNTPEYVPLLKESRIMAERSRNKRDRAIILTAATTGLRNSALRALRVGDILTELKSGKEILLINVKHDWNERIPGACKNCIPYYTFTAKIATEAVKSMLTEREASFGSLLPEEPLFISNYNQIRPDQRRMKPLTARELEIIVKKAAEAGDIPEWNNVHVHTMRKVFESVLRSPLIDDGRMDPKDQEFLMGHILRGSQDNYYDSTKIEKIRELYSKLVFEDRPSVEEQSLQTLRKVVKIYGVNPLEAKLARENDLGRKLSNQEEEELLEELLRQQIKQVRCEQGQEEQKIVDLDGLDGYIKSGWLFVSTLPNNKVVVKTLRHRER